MRGRGKTLKNFLRRHGFGGQGDAETLKLDGDRGQKQKFGKQKVEKDRH
jgi:hypothetical protein